MDESGEKICAGKDDYRHPRHRKVEQPVAHHCQHSELPKTPPPQATTCIRYGSMLSIKSAMGSAQATIESKC
jgi:hypothetical protein